MDVGGFDEHEFNDDDEQMETFRRMLVELTDGNSFATEMMRRRTQSNTNLSFEFLHVNVGDDLLGSLVEYPSTNLASMAWYRYLSYLTSQYLVVH